MSSKRRDWCKHYRAMSDHDTCKAGVRYETLRGVKFDDRPCFDQVHNGKDICSLCEYQTEEEKAAEKAAMDKRFADTMKAREAIVEACGGPWKRGETGIQGVVDCPVCGGNKTLQFSRSGYNGHIHADGRLRQVDGVITDVSTI